MSGYIILQRDKTKRNTVVCKWYPSVEVLYYFLKGKVIW